MKEVMFKDVPVGGFFKKNGILCLKGTKGFGTTTTIYMEGARKNYTHITHPEEMVTYFPAAFIQLPEDPDEDLEDIDILDKFELFDAEKSGEKVPESFEPGDVVVLKSGGPQMTVSDVVPDAASVTVVWWAGEICREVFKGATLTASPREYVDTSEDTSEVSLSTPKR